MLSCIYVVSAVVFPAQLLAAYQCPGSSAHFLHAWCEVTVAATEECHKVADEIVARVNGTSDGRWIDPHNSGTYTILGRSDSALNIKRITGDKLFTDKATITFQDASGNTGVIRASSESQVFSILDFSTNYCNLRMLYCGSAQGCQAVKHDFTFKETEVLASGGGGTDPNACGVRSQSLVATDSGRQKPTRYFTSPSTLLIMIVATCAAVSTWIYCMQHRSADQGDGSYLPLA